eukprot:TRINITY_DN7159_c0_g1_i15.p1 TRINITY_DN7159_c0_g1~~TRINITY_DN7159_c0_g1_i15.p1  ORF type:complete len:443 (-),score=77.93 TRINITY_DN7159_c0_g1_i15:35-1363(-)
MCELFEVAFFTASTSNYADKVLNELDPERKAPHRLFRQHCTLINCEFVKDLSQLGRDLKDVIMVDNLPSCYALQPCNGIPISTWTDNKNDRELDLLAAVLESLSKVDDVRDYLREVVRDNELNYSVAIKLLNGEVTLDEIQKNPSAYWTSPRKKLAPPKERTQSQKKLMPYLGSLKENLDNKKDATTDKNSVPVKNDDKEGGKAEIDKPARTLSINVTILSQELLAEMKERSMDEEKTQSVVHSNSAIEQSSTPAAAKTARPQLSRANSSSVVGDACGHKVPPSGGKGKSKFAKQSSDSVKEGSEKPKLPPRPNYTRNPQTFTPKPITNLSSEVNKFANTSYSSKEKPPTTSVRRYSSNGIDSSLQSTLYKPPVAPSYVKYINTQPSQPSLHRYPVRNGHSSTTSMYQPSYANLLGGSSTPSRNYVPHATPVSGRVWTPKLY